MFLKAAPYVAVGIIALWCYIFMTNAYIYHKIHKGNLIFPDITHSYTLTGPLPQKTYAALGDSLTSGVGASKYEESFPYLLAQKFAAKNRIELKVFAYPGERSTGLITNFLASATESKPDIVTILIGTNDIHGRVPAREFEKNYRTILESLSKTQAEIYAISIPYIGSRTLIVPPLRWYFDWKTRQFNEIITRLAAEYEAEYVDIAESTKAAFNPDSNLYSADSFHPSALGYRLWSDTIYADISQ